MSILADWKQHRKLKRAFADAQKRKKQEERRKLILEWYKLLKPFHSQSRRYGERNQLTALADALSRRAIWTGVRWFIQGTGALIVFLALLFLLAAPDQRHNHIFFGLVGLGGFIGVIALAFHGMRIEIRYHLEDYAEGKWVHCDPFTGKEVYKLMTCPRCERQGRRDHYLRCFEACEYCGHNIDWETVKRP